ncbi:glucose-1-phosphate adenylyltransferase [Ligilactobacillus apodemi DSM 16634 = JCM 16172]|uniref:Glucose-1-phosphate adenylyltransferase n=2 Tax=Ligilactobacillus TaxID=2767887 RepID=A0A0R1U540_9LACO|nr:glucose-1-phosphate adenylyltransferase [Ligilactobacillus apodemi DSM 16634 = JCM 16172]
MCAILGNEHEYNGLLPLTANRPLSTLYFDCKYRIMDFALSSAVNANIRTVYMILNEGRVKSVFDHVGGGREWGLDSIGSYQYLGFYQDILRKKAEGKPYFNDMIGFLEKAKSEYTVFFGNKMLCNVDLRSILDVHQANGAKITVVFKRVPKEKIAPDDCILTLTEDNRVQKTDIFSELEDNQELYNLSMSIFLVKTDWLLDLLHKGQNAGAPASVQDLLNREMTRVKTRAYEYTGYLSNIHDIKSYYDANMDMLDPEHFNALLFSSQKVITRTKNEVATHFYDKTKVKRSQFATGCIIKGEVEHSLISRRTVIEEDAVVRDSVIMSNANIKRGATIQYAIFDKNVEVEAGVRIKGTPENPVVITKGSHVVADIYGGEK